MYLIRRLTWSIGCFVVGDTLSTDAPGLIGTRCTLECPLFDSSVAPTELRSPTLHLSTYAPVSRATLTTCEIAWDACKYRTIGGYACAQCCCEPSSQVWRLYYAPSPKNPYGVPTPNTLSFLRRNAANFPDFWKCFLSFLVPSELSQIWFHRRIPANSNRT